MASISIKKLSEEKKVIIHGRSAEIPDVKKINEELTEGSYPLFWTGSALEFNVKGSCFNVKLFTDYDQYELWVSILINGAFSQRLMLEKGVNDICCFRSMNPDEVKNVRVIREVQPFDSDKSQLLIGMSAATDGEFLEAEEKKLKLEFIGDSITSSEGCIGAKNDMDWLPMFFSAINSYSFLTAEALNADFRVVSQSGWGLLCGWDGNPYSNIPEYYTKVCGLQKGDRQKAAGSDFYYDFSKWQPDAIILNLGTNDNSAFDQPEWKGENGESFNLKLDPDGSFNREDAALWKAAAERFLFNLRENNPKAEIIWALGMLGHRLDPLVNEAIEQYKKSSGDERVVFVPLNESNEETVGSRCHPGRLCHELAAEKLAKVIKKLL